MPEAPPVMTAVAPGLKIAVIVGGEGDVGGTEMDLFGRGTFQWRVE